MHSPWIFIGTVRLDSQQPSDGYQVALKKSKDDLSRNISNLIEGVVISIANVCSGLFIVDLSVSKKLINLPNVSGMSWRVSHTCRRLWRQSLYRYCSEYQVGYSNVINKEGSIYPVRGQAVACSRRGHEAIHISNSEKRTVGSDVRKTCQCMYESGFLALLTPNPGCWAPVHFSDSDEPSFRTTVCESAPCRL